MNNRNYKNIQKLNIDVTKKLLKYISQKMQDEDLIEEIGFFHDDFIDHELAFNVWLSFDFVDKYGQSFIDKFLKEKSHTVSKNEREILVERNNSNVSLFEIIDMDKEFIHVIDLFQHKYYTLWEPDLSSALNVDDLVFGRIANLLGAMTFIGDINYLPVSARDTFLREALRDFNILREGNSSMTIRQYLKENSMELYNIYTNCIFEIIESEEDINTIFYGELNEFQSYLKVKAKETHIKKHITNLIDFFEYYLAEDDLSLSDLDEVDFNLFFQEAIENSFMLSIEDLNSYISTFKFYLGFLSNKDSKYKESYKSILEISKSRFQIAKFFDGRDVAFKLDHELRETLEGHLNDYSLLLTMDFDRLMLYALNAPIALTRQKKKIQRKHLLEINNMFEFSIDVVKKSPNQKDFPVIDMLYNFALDLKLMTIEKHNLVLNHKGSNYLRLRDEEKYTIFFDYIWSDKFIGKVANIEDEEVIKTYKKNLLQFFSSLEENSYYKVSDILPDTSLDQSFFLNYYIFLQYVGIIEYKLYPNYEMKVTHLGKAILDYLNFKSKNKKKASVISLDSFKKLKES